MVGIYDIKIYQGSDKRVQLVLKEDDDTLIDLNGYTAEMHIRPKASGRLLDELSTDNERIVITSAEGKIELIFPNTVTSDYRFRQAVYDLELYSGGDVRRLIEGNIIVYEEVTKQ